MTKHNGKRKAQKVKTDTYVCYTDGSYRPHTFGAWAYCVMKDGKPVGYDAQAVRDTTINQMELQAICEVFKRLPSGSKVIIFSDSMYAIRCMRDWALAWRRNNWISAAGEPIRNKELIDLMLDLQQKFTSVKYIHVYGHSGNVHNEIVDFLARSTSHNDREKWYAENNKAITSAPSGG